MRRAGLSPSAELLVICYCRFLKVNYCVEKPVCCYVSEGKCALLFCHFSLCQSVAAKKRTTAVSGADSGAEVGPASKHARLDQQPSGGGDDDQLGN